MKGAGGDISPEKGLENKTISSMNKAISNK